MFGKIENMKLTNRPAVCKGLATLGSALIALVLATNAQAQALAQQAAAAAVDNGHRPNQVLERDVCELRVP